MRLVSRVQGRHHFTMLPLITMFRDCALGLACALVAATIPLAAGPANAQSDGTSDEPVIQDRHADYYYPSPVSQEYYVSRAQVMDDASQQKRLVFVNGVTREQLARPYWPPFTMFAKGDRSQKMLIIANGPGGFTTLYQARAVLAQLTASSRGTPLFQDLNVQDIFTFFDLARMLGFKQITISDGRSFSHRVVLE